MLAKGRLAEPATAPNLGLDYPMLGSRYSHGKLYALAVAIEAAAARDPYPRLAQFMRTLEIQEAEGRRTFHRPAHHQVHGPAA